jgi:hypothetical protein
MVKRVVRITRTWEVEVDAEYGDSDADLLERAKPGTISEAKETRSLLPMGVTIADLEDPDGRILMMRTTPTRRVKKWD